MYKPLARTDDERDRTNAGSLCRCHQRYKAMGYNSRVMKVDMQRP